MIGARILSLPLRAARYVQHRWFLAPRGYGRPVASSLWDSQYRSGVWDHLDSLPEMAHHMVIAGYVRHAVPRPAIVDVGCGHGLLAEIVSGFSFSSYLGVDLSPEAIERAKARGIANARFQVADFEEWTPPEPADVLIWNESLSYAKHPADVLSRIGHSLTVRGVAIVSLCRHGHHDVIWRTIDRHWQTLDHTVVENGRGQFWDIKMLGRSSVMAKTAGDLGATRGVPEAQQAERERRGCEQRERPEVPPQGGPGSAQQ